MLRILNLENCFKKIGVGEKTFGWNIGAKMLLDEKLISRDKFKVGKSVSKIFSF